MPVEARTFVSLGYIWQSVCCLESKIFVELHFNIPRFCLIAQCIVSERGSVHPVIAWG